MRAGDQRAINSDICPSHKVVVAVHLFSEQKYEALFNKLSPLLAMADEIWLSSSKFELLIAAKKYLSSRYINMIIEFNVNNRWHDWSSYLEFLRAYDGSSQLVVCNDSIVTRRVMGKRTINRFIGDLLKSKQSLIGELDTSRNSVDLNGWSSACWISTYLFALQGIAIDVSQLENDIEEDVSKAQLNPDHMFNRYIDMRRNNSIIGENNKRAKLGAMFLERRLTKLAIEQGLQIINYCAGSRARKIERIMERLRDG